MREGISGRGLGAVPLDLNQMGGMPDSGRWERDAPGRQRSESDSSARGPFH